MFFHLSMLGGYWVYCVLLMIGYFPYMSTVMTLGVMVEVCSLLYVEDKQLLKCI